VSYFGHWCRTQAVHPSFLLFCESGAAPQSPPGPAPRRGDSWIRYSAPAAAGQPGASHASTDSRAHVVACEGRAAKPLAGVANLSTIVAAGRVASLQLVATIPPIPPTMTPGHPHEPGVAFFPRPLGLTKEFGMHLAATALAKVVLG
jgi:hypothetical protein